LSDPAGDLSVDLADYGDPDDAEDLLLALDTYAYDPMGGGQRLADEVRDRVIAGLAATPGAFSVLARQGGDVAGFANCLTGFSTFAAKPVINIHDFGVMPGHRGRGIGRKLLAAIESEAKKRGACKVTLEVLSGNEPARALYRSCGFGNYALDPAAGTAQFWEKKLA
jgi:ribosomal protein S18 acetylase RimI-like enzyme